MADVGYRMVVHGRVQGVGFRDWTERTASAHGLSGWCRNRRDGTVEIMVSGHQEKVETFRTEVHTGPTVAKVENVEASEIEERFSGAFEVRATA
ncbi:acylphosphatase [Fulvimarina sp. MAC8]|uniref:acylphosphatase n=1 Tax=Fulvimarina sp. MAC8 TaxID=3162874 RepID=UPI0032EBF985